MYGVHHIHYLFYNHAGNQQCYVINQCWVDTQVESTLSESLKQSLTSTLLTSTLFKYFQRRVTRTSMLVPFHIHIEAKKMIV